MKNKTITHFDQFNLRKYIFKSLRLKKTIQTIPLSYNTSTISLLVSSRVSTLPSPPPFLLLIAYIRILDGPTSATRFTTKYDLLSASSSRFRDEREALRGKKKFSPEVFGWKGERGREGEERERKKEADKKKRRMGTTGTRVVTFPFEIRVCTYGFQNVERHK